MTYSIKYKIEKGNFTKEQLIEEECGGADALFIVSIMRDGKGPHQGPASYVTFSIEGTGDQTLEDSPSVPMTELFAIMCLMAKDISESTVVPDWQHRIALNTFETARAKVVGHSDGFMKALTKGEENNASE